MICDNSRCAGSAVATWSTDISLRLLGNGKWPGRTWYVFNDPWSTSTQWRTCKTRMKKSSGSMGVGAWDLIQQTPFANFVWSSDDYYLLRLSQFILVEIYRPVLDRLEPADWSNKILQNNSHGGTDNTAPHFRRRWVFCTYTHLPHNNLITYDEMYWEVMFCTSLLLHMLQPLIASYKELTQFCTC
jgi:hypothetical protein